MKSWKLLDSCFKNTQLRVAKLVRRVKASAAKQEDLSWIPGTHMVKRKDRLLKIALWCPLVPEHAPTHINNTCENIKNSIHLEEITPYFPKYCSWVLGDHVPVSKCLALLANLSCSSWHKLGQTQQNLWPQDLGRWLSSRSTWESLGRALTNMVSALYSESLLNSSEVWPGHELLEMPTWALWRVIHDFLLGFNSF